MYSLYILNTKVVNINIYEDNPYTIRIYENNCPHFTSIEKNYEQIIIQQRLTTKFLGFKPNYRHYSIQSLQSLQLEHQAIIFNIVITIFNLLELFVCILLDYVLYYSFNESQKMMGQ